MGKSGYGGFLKWEDRNTPIAGWFIMENPFEMDNLGIPLFRNPPYIFWLNYNDVTIMSLDWWFIFGKNPLIMDMLFFQVSESSQYHSASNIDQLNCFWVSRLVLFFTRPCEVDQSPCQKAAGAWRVSDGTCCEMIPESPECGACYSL